MNLIEIMNRKTLLSDQIAVAMSEERIEDARRLEGRIAELDEMMMDAAKAEEELRARAAAGAVVSGRRPCNLTERLIGFRDEFNGIEEGFRNTATIVSIGDPTIEETSVPGWGESPWYTFAGTLAQGVTDGDVKFLRRKTRTNSAATWTPNQESPSEKAQSYYEWEKATAQLEIVAHHVPIEKPTLKRYGELMSIIENELTIGKAEVLDAKCLSGNTATGIVGVLNTSGLQTHTRAQTGEHAVDAIRKMVTKCINISRMYPDYVAVAPQVKEAIDLLKDDNGSYLTIMTNGRVWNLPLIEDVNLVIDTTAGGTTTRHYGAVVYCHRAATLFSTGEDALEVGYIDKQFTKNQLSLLLEGEHALKVAIPDAFVYCQDAIDSVTVE